MESKYILGKDIAQKKDQETLEFVQECKQKGKRIPKLINIAVGHNEASASYMRGLQKKCDALQVILENKILDEDVSEAELIRLIHNCNKLNSVDGILLQMPLPAHVDADKVVCEIDPMKDIDGMHPLNVGYFSKGQDGFVPCTALSAMEFIHASGINLKGKKVVVVGRSNVIGKPVALLCLNENASVTIVHSKSAEIEEICASADVLIAAVGKAKLISESWIKKGAIVIDVGVNVDENGKLCGDVDCEKVLEKVSRITPVPRGVGVVTNSMLLQNLIKAYKKRR